ncbi:hypothetical protein C8R44DRAFT_766147 [Mycena epipterygia]|nr:hypothetical protein C8R44DRAFT_766147 [Mycena epipterygia]
MALSESSTTRSQAFILEKYSRAYPPKDAGTGQWQHFTNPILRLILDTKRSPERAESFRMRIVWTMNGGPASGAAQQDVVLEDLDLLAFSSLKDNTSDSSPLKGVYRDTTFGLRYLHVSDSPDSQKVQRRFQVSFTTPSAALQLVEAIRDVCPCKPTESRVPVGKKAAGVSQAIAPPMHQTAVVPNLQEQTTLRHAISMAPASTQMQCVTTMQTPDPPAVFMSSPVTLLSSQPELPTVFSSSPCGPDKAPPGPSPYRSLYDPIPSASQPAASMFPGTNPLPKPASFPDSSPPPSSMDSVMMPPPPPPPASADNLIAALRDATGLYDLSHAALERLVGDVVREDKFAHLVRLPVLKFCCLFIRR